MIKIKRSKNPQKIVSLEMAAYKFWGVAKGSSISWVAKLKGDK